jgi:ferredoxin
MSQAIAPAQQTGDFVATLPVQGWQFQLTAGSTVLAAALAAGISLPSSCRNGSCRTCMCQLLSGQVAYTIEWPGISRDERQDGLILPCVAVALSDLLMQVPHAKLVSAK